MVKGDRQGASEWPPVELAPPETAASGEASEDSDDPSHEEQSPAEAVDAAVTVEEQDEDGEPSPPPGEAEIERLLERAERTQGALRKAEVQSEGAEERVRLTAETESAIQRAAVAEATAREAAETVDRLAAKLIVLTDRLAAHEKELISYSEPEQQRRQVPAIDINEATFEELCRVGLSITQAARLIGQRGQRGGFSSLDDLDGLSGLPRDTIEMLKDAASD